MFISNLNTCVINHFSHSLIQLILFDEELLRAQLAAQCPSLSPSQLPDFVHFWHELSSAQLECVCSAASAHLRFLRLSSELSDDRTLCSALALLHLLLRHSAIVEPLLAAADASVAATRASASTPNVNRVAPGPPAGDNGSASAGAMDAAVWTQLVPQLAAQLTHPDARVRRVVSALLVRVASRAAHVVLYPVVVGERLAQDAGITALDGYSSILQHFEMQLPG